MFIDSFPTVCWLCLPFGATVLLFQIAVSDIFFFESRKLKSQSCFSVSLSSLKFFKPSFFQVSLLEFVECFQTFFFQVSVDYLS